MVEIIKKQISESIRTKEALLADTGIALQMESLAQVCLEALRGEGKIIFAGNGGSFADAQHLSAEFTSRFLFDRKPLPSLALGTNNSSLSAIGNDYGYEQIFARELQGIARPEDIFIAISTSGNSQNILLAVDVARDLNLRTIAMTGKTGGKLVEKCECIKIPSDSTARIQECHITLGHILCELVEMEYFHKIDATGCCL